MINHDQKPTLNVQTNRINQSRQTQRSGLEHSIHRVQAGSEENHKESE